jgi:hypothetical protein
MSTSTVKGRRRLTIATSLACVFLFGGTRLAQAVYTLHIDSQPLDSALQELARQTGLQILFFSDITEGRRSVALNGRYTLETAMATLLSDSNLTYRLINAKTIQVVPMRAGRADRQAEGGWR